MYANKGKYNLFFSIKVYPIPVNLRVFADFLNSAHDAIIGNRKNYRTSLLDGGNSTATYYTS